MATAYKRILAIDTSIFTNALDSLRYKEICNELVKQSIPDATDIPEVFWKKDYTDGIDYPNHELYVCTLSKCSKEKCTQPSQAMVSIQDKMTCKTLIIVSHSCLSSHEILNTYMKLRHNVFYKDVQHYVFGDCIDVGLPFAYFAESYMLKQYQRTMPYSLQVCMITYRTYNALRSRSTLMNYLQCEKYISNILATLYIFLAFESCILDKLPLYKQLKNIHDLEGIDHILKARNASPHEYLMYRKCMKAARCICYSFTLSDSPVTCVHNHKQYFNNDRILIECPIFATQEVPVLLIKQKVDSLDMESLKLNPLSLDLKPYVGHVVGYGYVKYDLANASDHKNCDPFSREPYVGYIPLYNKHLIVLWLWTMFCNTRHAGLPELWLLNLYRTMMETGWLREYASILRPYIETLRCPESMLITRTNDQLYCLRHCMQKIQSDETGEFDDSKQVFSSQLEFFDKFLKNEL